MITGLVRLVDPWHGIAGQHRVSAQQLQLDVAVIPVQAARYHRYEALILRAVCIRSRDGLQRLVGLFFKT